MTDCEIASGTRVTLHFAIKLEDGSIVDSTFGGNPATFEVGDGSLLPGFEQVLVGEKVGAKKEFSLNPEQGFGVCNEASIQRIPRTQFSSDLDLKEGLVISFADAGRNELPGVVKSLDDDMVEVDFNHPLAGRNLLFEVEVLAVSLSTIVKSA